VSSVVAAEVVGRAFGRRAFTEMRLSRFGRAVFCFPTKETALLHANFAMDSIPHSLQAFLLIAGGMIGLLAAFSLVDSYAAESRASHEARASAENRVDSGSHAPVERGASGRRF